MSLFVVYLCVTILADRISADQTKLSELFSLLNVSLPILDHISKIFKELVLKYIIPSVTLTLINEQYGFRPERLSVINLLVLNNFILEAF